MAVSYKYSFFSEASFTEHGVERDFHVSETVAILAISLFVGGLGLGPLLVGPLSEVYGRNIVYRVSYFLFFILQFPVAFAPNAGKVLGGLSFHKILLLPLTGVYLTFRFITGFCGSAFLTVSGGTVSDMFPDSSVAK